MARAKLTARQYPDDLQRVQPLRTVKQKRTVYPFKIKLTLPEEKTVNIKKDSQVLQSINVHKKSTGKNWLIF